VVFLRANVTPLLRRDWFTAPAQQTMLPARLRHGTAVYVQMPGSTDGLKLARAARVAGRRSGLSQPPATFARAKPICLRMDDFAETLHSG